MEEGDVMIEPQSTEIEYRQNRLMAEAANRRLAASQVHGEAKPARHGRSRRTLVGSIGAALRNLGVFALLCATLLVGGCTAGQGVAESSPLAAAPMVAPSAPAISDGLSPTEIYGAPGRHHRR
jgi:hypothetical protein